MKTVFEGTYAELQKQIALLPVGSQVRLRIEFVPEGAPPIPPGPTLMEEIYSTRPRESHRTNRQRTATAR